MMELSLDAHGQRAMKVAASLGPRLSALVRWLPYWLAKSAFDEIRAGIPRGAEHRGYRDSLRLVEASLGGGLAAFAIQSDSSARGVKEIDPARVVVYVRVRRRRLVKAPPAIQILQRHSPWTLETIPFVPTQREARVFTRKVSLHEVEAVSAARREDESDWRRDLARVGSRSGEKRKRIAVPRAIGKHVPDVAFEALRLEFGMGGVNAVPHWKPALRLVKTRLRALPRRQDVVKLLSSPSYSGFRRWVPRLRKIRSGEAKKFTGFQQMLNLTPGAMR